MGGTLSEPLTLRALQRAARYVYSLPEGSPERSYARQMLDHHQIVDSARPQCPADMGGMKAREIEHRLRLALWPQDGEPGQSILPFLFWAGVGLLIWIALFLLCTK